MLRRAASSLAFISTRCRVRCHFTCGQRETSVHSTNTLLRSGINITDLVVEFYGLVYHVFVALLESQVLASPRLDEPLNMNGRTRDAAGNTIKAERWYAERTAVVLLNARLIRWRPTCRAKLQGNIYCMFCPNAPRSQKQDSQKNSNPFYPPVHQVHTRKLHEIVDEDNMTHSAAAETSSNFLSIFSSSFTEETTERGLTFAKLQGREKHVDLPRPPCVDAQPTVAQTNLEAVRGRRVCDNCGSRAISQNHRR